MGNIHRRGLQPRGRRSWAPRRGDDARVHDAAGRDCPAGRGDM